jgi:hypothetical protein
MKVRRLFRRLAAEAPVHSCYETSGAGFVLHRVLADDGFTLDRSRLPETVTCARSCLPINHFHLPAHSYS